MMRDSIVVLQTHRLAMAKDSALIVTAESILDHFDSLPDPRSHINRKHLLGDLSRSWLSSRGRKVQRRSALGRRAIRLDLPSDFNCPAVSPRPTRSDDCSLLSNHPPFKVALKDGSRLFLNNTSTKIWMSSLSTARLCVDFLIPSLRWVRCFSSVPGQSSVGLVLVSWQRRKSRTKSRQFPNF